MCVYFSKIALLIHPLHPSTSQETSLDERVLPQGILNLTDISKYLSIKPILLQNIQAQRYHSLNTSFQLKIESSDRLSCINHSMYATKGKNEIR